MNKKDEYPARLIRAMQEDTSILTSALAYFDVERQKRLERLSKENDPTTFYRIQGESHAFAFLRAEFARLTKLKEPPA